MFLKQFILQTIIAVVISTALCLSLFLVFIPEHFILFYAFLPLIFGLINILIFKSLFKSEELALLKFTTRYLFFTTIKLLGSLILIIAFIYFNRSRIIPFLSTFLVVYLLFLVQEIITILKFFKKKEKIEKTHDKT
jgi:hypothetical protein